MEQPWEDSLSSIPRELSDRSLSTTNKLEETQIKPWESSKLSNMPTSMESFAQPVGNPDQKLLSQIKKRWKNISTIYEKNDYQSNLIKQKGVLK